MATEKKKEKAVDLPPKGSRNPDPITGEPGAHPIGTGVGAAVGGGAAGFAAGMAAGPVGAVAGAVVGAVAGGLAGKGIEELIDPTVDDDYLRKNFASRPYVKKGEAFDTYVPAYRYGGRAEAEHGGKTFVAVEPHLKSGWEAARGSSTMAWDHARPAVQEAYERTIQLRRERQAKAK
ncbi:MAG: hypothetical protein ACJ8F7_21740 [Gemmataceae bacterium]